MFHFRGCLPFSKSWLNRIQIINYYLNKKTLSITSDSSDVIELQKCIQNFLDGKLEFNLGQGGTTFRFFSFLISKKPGHYILKMHPRLFERPHDGLILLLNQLGIQMKRKNDYFEMISSGWHLSKEIKVTGSGSSQFLSGLLLNAWNLKEELKLTVSKPIQSYEYLKMTLALLEKFKLKINFEENTEFLKISILPKQFPKDVGIDPEIDISSVFSLAACAVVDGDIEIQNWSQQTTQPDKIFLDIFDQMKINYQIQENTLKISRQTHWNSIDVNLNNTPDLFPVLAVLAALAEGVSCLHGAEQLKDKESNRIDKTAELLRACGFNTEEKDDGLIVWGKSSNQDKKQTISFNTDHDHRMAMAAACLKLAGYNIKIDDPHVVNKSYPEFWSHIGASV